MAEDIAPVLLKDIQKAFKSNLKAKGVEQQKYIAKARDGTLTSITKYTEKVGNALAKAYEDVITPDILPDGTLYYNIATRTVTPTLKEAHKMVSDVADELQTAQNRRIGIGIKPIRPPIEMDRVNGIIDLVTDGLFEELAHYLNEPVKNIVDHFGDYHLQKNAEFLESSGVGTVVVRTAEATCCQWCSERAGTYNSYQEAADNEAFARHEGCRCELEIQGGGTSGKMRARGRGFVRTT